MLLPVLPFKLVIGPRGEGGAFDDLAHLLPAEAEVVDGPHIGELNHFDLDKHKMITDKTLHSSIHPSTFFPLSYIRSASVGQDIKKRHIKTAFYLNAFWQQTGWGEQGIKRPQTKTLGENDGKINESINGTCFTSHGDSEHAGGSCEVTHTQNTE